MSYTFEFIVVFVRVYGGGRGGRGEEGCLSFRMVLCMGCWGRTVFYVCIQYHIEVNTYHVSAQGVDERMINCLLYTSPSPRDFG